MPGMYPDEQVVTIFGQEVLWPGLDPATRKFTNGSFNDPLIKPSFIPAETINLILDNIANLLIECGITPNNTDPDQLKNAVGGALAEKADLAFAVIAGHPVGSLYFSVSETSPAELFGGTWTRWGQGRVPVGVNESSSSFNTVEKTGGAATHTLSESEMPYHNHDQDWHSHNLHMDINGQVIGWHNNLGWGSGTNAFSSNNMGEGLNRHGTLVADWRCSHIYHKGSSWGHNNLQPYMTCYIWKRTA